MQKILDYLSDLSKELWDDGDDDLARLVIIIRSCFEEIFEDE